MGTVTIMTTGLRLDEQECWALLRTGEVGRLCYTKNALPVIRPVPFVVAGTNLVTAVGASAPLSEVFGRPSIVAFETGEWTLGQRHGWSVQAVGKAQAVPRHTVAHHVQEALAPWIGDVPAQFVRLEVTVLTGQRVTSPADS
jgi:uncharacterized protein